MQITILTLITYIFLTSLMFYIFFKIIETMKNLFLYKKIGSSNKVKYSPITTLLGDINIDSLESKQTGSFFNCIQKQTISLPLDLILDGLIIYKNLYALKKDYNWLVNCLNKKGYKDVKNITHACLDSNGKIKVYE